MKLVLYSGGYLEENEGLNEQLLQLLNKRRPSITYIPSSYDHDEEYYEEFITHFSELGIKYINVFPVDQPFGRRELKNALKSDAIYLSGGNTFYFLKHLRDSGALQSIQRYVRRGGILMGESAGSIIMTPDIHTAGYPAWDKDDNEVDLKNLSSMGLVNFDFFPHYEHETSYQTELLYRSKLTPRPIYAVADGSGIVVDGERTSFIGDVYCYVGGVKFRLR